MTHRAGQSLFRLNTHSQALPFSSPLPPTPNRFHYTLWAGGGEGVYPVSTPHPPSHSTDERDSRGVPIKPDRTTPRFSLRHRRRPAPLPSLPPLPLLTNSGHVPLWDRLPSLQVDPAPAHTLRHYFWHYRHRRHLRMGRGRGGQVALRQYVDWVPGEERPVAQQVAHGELWVVPCFPTTA